MDTKRIALYLTAGHASVTVQNGAAREVSSPTLSETISNMQPRDRETLVRLAQAIIRFDEMSDEHNAMCLDQQIGAK